VHLIAKGYRFITAIIIKKCFVKCCFLTDDVSSSDGSAVKPTEDEEEGWHS
jgi:hypothetical protein